MRTHPKSNNMYTEEGTKTDEEKEALTETDSRDGAKETKGSLGQTETGRDQKGL